MGKYTLKPALVDAMKVSLSDDFGKFIRDLGGWVTPYRDYVVVNSNENQYKAAIGSWVVVYERSLDKTRVINDSSFKKLFDSVESQNTKIDWKPIIECFKEITKKNISTINPKAKRHFSARLKEGHTLEVLKKAIRNCYEDDYHKETNHKYLTLEFISRPDKFERYLHQNPDSHTNHNYKNPFK